MKEMMNENKTLVVLLSVLVLVFLGAIYYYIVYPKTDEATRLANSIEQLTVENDRVTEEIATYRSEISAEDAYEFRKKLPETRSVSELLRSLEEVELVSEAKITSIAFNNYDSLVSESSYGLVDEESETGDEDIDTINRVQEERREQDGLDKDSDNGDADVPETMIDVESLPEELKLLSYSLQVDVQNYEHLLTFLQELEGLERVKRVENVSFSQGGEAELETINADESMSVSLQVTTFYSEVEAE